MGQANNATLAADTLIADKYRVIELIGYGGVGEVYLAKDEKIQRLAAIKLLFKELNNDIDHKSRFLREARTISSLNHPNIITVYEIGFFDDQLFIATEYVEGQTLRQIVEKKGSFKLKDFFSIAIQSIQGLMIAHQNGIVHRDLKLENFILRSDGLVKILDFGLAKVSDNCSNTVLRSGAGFKTDAGVILGTPNYMSPEQAKGEDVDIRSDIFSLGSVFYELLTGKVAFDGNSLVQTLMNLAVSQPPPMPATVPSKLKAVIMRMLQKSPAARYQTIEQVLTELASLYDELNLANNLTNYVTTANKIPTGVYKKVGTAALTPTTPQYDQFVGRIEELQLIQTQILQMGQQSAHPIIILSNSGAGKTFLLSKLQEIISQQDLLVTLVNLFDQDNFTQPYQWILPMLANLLGFRFEDSLMDKSGALAQRVNARIKARYGLTLPAEIWSQNLETKHESEKWPVFEVINQILQALVKDKKLLILFDNLHLANELSLELIGYTIRNNSNKKIFLVATTNLSEINRSGSFLEDWFFRQSKYVKFEIVDLKSFTLEETKIYFEALFRQIEISERELNYIYQITNGNPYYLSEVVRLLVQEGKIHLVGSWWHCEALENIALPNTIGTALLYKIEKCDEELKELITKVSILGNNFSFDLLTEFLEFEPEKLEPLLVEAEKEHFIYEQRSSKIDEYCFQSSALQQVLYDSLSKRQRRKLHSQAALAIKKIFQNNLRQVLSTLTFHHYAATEWQETFYFGQQAIIQSFEQSAWGEVVKLGQLVEEAATILQENQEINLADLALLVDIKNKHASALVNLGKLELALTIAQSALQLAEKLQDNNLLAQSYGNLSHFGWYQGRFKDVIIWAEKGLSIAQIAQNKFWQQQLNLQTGRAKLRVAHYKEALFNLTEACRLAEQLQEEKLLAHAQVFQGLCLQLLGERQKGFELVEKGMALANKLGDSLFLCRAYSMLSVMYFYEYNTDSLKDIHKKGVALSRQIGWRLGEVYQHVYLGNAYLFEISFDIDQASNLLQHALALALEIGDKATTLVIKRGIAKIAALEGDYHLATNQLKQFVAVLKSFGELPEQMLTLEVLAQIQESAGENAVAYDTYNNALEIAQNIGAIHQQWSILLGKARCLFKLEKLEEALETLKLSEKIVKILLEGFTNDEDSKCLTKATQSVYQLLRQIQLQSSTN